MATPQRKMNRAGKPRPVPNRKRAAAGGTTSSRRGVSNGQSKSKPKG